MNTLSTIWTAIPNGLKKFIGYGLAAGIAMAIVMLTFLSFPLLTDHLKEKLGIQKDIHEVQNGLSARSDEEINRAIEFTARAIVATAMDSLSHANDSLFSQISTDLIEPGIDKLNNVATNVRRLNERLGLSNELLNQQANAQRETNDRIGLLQQQLNGSDQDAKLNAILIQLQTIEREQEAIQQRLRSTKSPKF